MTDITLPRDFAYARSEPHGLAAWLMGTDHKHVGLQYMATSLVFFCIGASIAITMRTQTIRPGMKVLSPEAYNRAFSIHGTTMIFLFAMPILIGFANYLVPLMIGARDMAFPRLNALSYWLFLFGGLLLYSGFLYGGVLDTGWFSYAPLTERAFSPHDGVSVWIVAISHARHLLGGRRGQLHHDDDEAARSGHDLAAHAALLPGHLRQLVPHPVRLPQPHGRRSPCSTWTASTTRAGTTPPAAAIPSSGSTCSGSSATPRCTSSSCRPSA